MIRTQSAAQIEEPVLFRFGYDTDACFRIYTGRPNREDRLGNIVRSKAPCQDYRCSDKLYDTAADRPIVGHAKRANLAIEWPMAVQEQGNR
jgi:hypothetical protein